MVALVGTSSWSGCNSSDVPGDRRELQASFRSPRLSLGPVGGAAIRLADAREHEPLIIGSIETVASVMVPTGWPGGLRYPRGGIEALGITAAALRHKGDHRRRSDLSGNGRTCGAAQPDSGWRKDVESGAANSGQRLERRAE